MKFSKKYCIFATISGATFLTGPAQSQVYEPPSDHPFSSSQTTYYGAGLLEDIETVGRCEVARQTKRAAIFVLTAPNSAQEQTAFKNLFGNNVSCLGLMTQLRVQRYVLRGVIAEALDALPSDRQPIAPGTIPLPAAKPSTLDGIADCYVRANPDAVHSYLATTKIATKGEKQKFGEMAQGFGPCIPTGATVTLDADRMRLALAEAAYRNFISGPK